METFPRVAVGSVSVSVSGARESLHVVGTETTQNLLVFSKILTVIKMLLSLDITTIYNKTIQSPFN